MPDPVAQSYLFLPGVVLLWILAGISLLLFGRRVAQFVGLLRTARPEIRWDQVPRRIGSVVKNVLGQRRLFQEPAFGVAHFLIFWAFVFFCTAFWWNLVRGLFAFLPIPYADDVGPMAFAMELLGLFALVAMVGAALRRYVFTPPGLERTWDASLVLVLISAVLVTFLVGQGAKAVSEEHASAWSPIGAPLGRGFASAGLTPDGGTSLYLWMWWIHMAVVLGFLVYLPYSKHAHLIFAPFGVFFASLKPGAMPPSSDGAARMEEFTWRQLFNALSCAECGRCERACPAYNSGFPLSPKDLMHKMKERVFAAVSSKGGSNGNWIEAGTYGADELWACTSCLACMDRCPVFNEHIPVIVEMRRHLVTEGEISTRIQEVLVNLTRYGNSFGKSARARSKWTRELDFPVKDARKEEVEYLWLVGDYASYDPRVLPSTLATARVFQKAGVDFGILFEGEQNAGNDVARIGEDGLFETLRDKNLKARAKAQYRKIVTNDPHTYHAVKHEYGNGMPVLHCTELVDELLRKGRLTVDRPLDGAVTYHDPCYLGRYSGVYAPPRRVVETLGAKLVEMPRKKGKAYCCGAGGGHIWMEDVPGIEERPAENRLREAAALDGIETFVVACPKDLVMFQDALKTTDLEGSLVVKDVMELVEAAITLPERSDAHDEAHAIG
ncbi:MAG: (Fe-S)-binding protein [Planctomycetota bacterium]|jgi:Fe-S oxidoreductase